jgi:hypothetical protein
MEMSSAKIKVKMVDLEKFQFHVTFEANGEFVGFDYLTRGEALFVVSTALISQNVNDLRSSAAKYYGGDFEKPFLEITKQEFGFLAEYDGKFSNMLCTDEANEVAASMIFGIKPPYLRLYEEHSIGDCTVSGLLTFEQKESDDE